MTELFGGDKIIRNFEIILQLCEETEKKNASFSIMQGENIRVIDRYM